jgi:diacylglycerol kinase (ATP)
MDVLHLADDTGRATHVANGVAAGFAGEVSNAVTQEAKERWGHMAFVMAAGTALSRLKPFRLRLTLDGALMEAKAVALLVMNGATIGGHRHVAPRAQPFDGKMDVVVVRHGALPRLLATGARLLQRRWPHDPQVAAFRCRRLHVTADEPLALTVDGETWGHRPCTVTVRPGALRVATTSLDGHCTA